MAAPTVQIAITSTGYDQVRRQIEELRRLGSGISLTGGGRGRGGRGGGGGGGGIDDLEREATRARTAFNQLRTSLGGADRAAAQLERAEQRLAQAMRGGNVSASEQVRLTELMRHKFDAVAASANMTSRQILAAQRATQAFMRAQDTGAGGGRRGGRSDPFFTSAEVLRAQRGTRSFTEGLERAKRREAAEIARDFDKLRSSYDHAGAAAARYQRELTALNRAAAAGLISGKQEILMRNSITRAYREQAREASGLRAELRQLNVTIAGGIAATVASRMGLGIGGALATATVARHAALLGGVTATAGLAGTAALGGAGIAGARIRAEERMMEAIGAGGFRPKLVELGIETGDMEAVITTFQRLQLARENLGASTQELIALEDDLLKMIRLQGGLTPSAAAGLFQLSQALAGIGFQGDEARSVIESLPIVTQAIGRGLVQMGIASSGTSAELRQLGSEGRLTGQVLMEALQRGATEATQAIEEMQPSLTTSLSGIATAAGEAYGEVGLIFEITPAMESGAAWLLEKLGGIAKNLAFIRDEGEHGAAFWEQLFMMGQVAVGGTPTPLRPRMKAQAGPQLPVGAAPLMTPAEAARAQFQGMMGTNVGTKKEPITAYDLGRYNLTIGAMSDNWERVNEAAEDARKEAEAAEKAWQKALRERLRGQFGEPLPHTLARDLIPAQQRGITTVAGLRAAFATGEAQRMAVIGQREAAFGMQATAAPSGLGAKSVAELRASLQGIEPAFDEAGQYIDNWGENVVTVIDGIGQELSGLVVTGIFESWDQAGQQFLRTLVEMGIQMAVIGSMHGIAGQMGAPTSAGAGLRGMGGLGGSIAQALIPSIAMSVLGGGGGAAVMGAAGAHGVVGGMTMQLAQHGAVLGRGSAALVEGSRDEAVIPLSRTSSGDLGVKTTGGGGPVVINADMSGATVTPGSIAAMRQTVFDLMPYISGQVASDFNNNQGLRKRARVR